MGGSKFRLLAAPGLVSSMKDTPVMRSYGSVLYSATSGSSGATKPSIDTLRVAGAVYQVVTDPSLNEMDWIGFRSPWFGPAIRLDHAAYGVTQNQSWLAVVPLISIPLTLPVAGSIR
jgi:hypothetical protein